MSSDGIKHSFIITYTFYTGEGKKSLHENFIDYDVYEFLDTMNDALLKIISHLGCKKEFVKFYTSDWHVDHCNVDLFMKTKCNIIKELKEIISRLGFFVLFGNIVFKDICEKPSKKIKIRKNILI